MKTALLLVDIQNDYFPGGKMELVAMAAAAAQAQALLAAFRRRQWPTFHIQHVSLRKGAPFFAPGTPGVEIHAGIAALPGETVIAKHFPNSFRDTGLTEILNAAGVGELVICGAMSHMCIDASTRATADQGFGCTVIHDACATMDLTFGEKVIPARQVHGAFMAALASFYARVLSREEFLRGLESPPRAHLAG
jgi:nicotinamidase-related amidase